MDWLAKLLDNPHIGIALMLNTAILIRVANLDWIYRLVSWLIQLPFKKPRKKGS